MKQTTSPSSSVAPRDDKYNPELCPMKQTTSPSSSVAPRDDKYNPELCRDRVAMSSSEMQTTLLSSSVALHDDKSNSELCIDSALTNAPTIPDPSFLMQGTTLTDLPPELLVRILSRLPCYKDVCICKCVSKGWNTLLSSSEFVGDFLSLYRSTPLKPLLRNQKGNEFLTAMSYAPPLFKRVWSWGTFIGELTPEQESLRYKILKRMSKVEYLIKFENLEYTLAISKFTENIERLEAELHRSVSNEQIARKVLMEFLESVSTP